MEVSATSNIFKHSRRYAVSIVGGFLLSVLPAITHAADIEINITPAQPQTITIDVTGDDPTVNYEQVNQFVDAQNEHPVKYFEVEKIEQPDEAFVASENPIVHLYSPALLTDLGYEIDSDHVYSKEHIARVANVILANASLIATPAIPELVIEPVTIDVVPQNHSMPVMPDMALAAPVLTDQFAMLQAVMEQTAFEGYAIFTSAAAYAEQTIAAPFAGAATAVTITVLLPPEKQPAVVVVKAPKIEHLTRTSLPAISRYETAAAYAMLPVLLVSSITLMMLGMMTLVALRRAVVVKQASYRGTMGAANEMVGDGSLFDFNEVKFNYPLVPANTSYLKLMWSVRKVTTDDGVHTYFYMTFFVPPQQGFADSMQKRKILSNHKSLVKL